jgi:HSP20 family protein
MDLWIWRPNLDALDDLHRQMNRLVDWTLNVVARQFNQSWQPLPSCNVYETPAEYQFIFPMPGLKADSLDIQVSGTQLTLKGERKRPQEIGDEQYRRQERWMGRWSRTLQLPDRADPDRVHATIEHGILLLQIAKIPEAQPRQVTVKVGQRGGDAASARPEPSSSSVPVERSES